VRMRCSRNGLVRFAVALGVLSTVVAMAGPVSARPSGRDVQAEVRESGFESFVGNTNVAGNVNVSMRAFGSATDIAAFGACNSPASTVCADDTLTFHNGDTLKWHDEGILVQMSGPPFPEVGHINRFSDVLTITGGTGRFTGATGELRATESSAIIASDPATSFVTKAVTESAVGTINIPSRRGETR
jgi:hypothetical protein